MEEQVTPWLYNIGLIMVMETLPCLKEELA